MALVYFDNLYLELTGSYTDKSAPNLMSTSLLGRFSWLSKKLFALKEPPDSPLPPSDLIDYTAHLVEVLNVAHFIMLIKYLLYFVDQKFILT